MSSPSRTWETRCLCGYGDSAVDDSTAQLPFVGLVLVRQDAENEVSPTDTSAAAQLVLRPRRQDRTGQDRLHTNVYSFNFNWMWPVHGQRSTSFEFLSLNATPYTSHIMLFLFSHWSLFRELRDHAVQAGNTLLVDDLFFIQLPRPSSFE